MMQVEQSPSSFPHPVTVGYFQHTKKEPLLQDFLGDILMVIEPDGISDVFCRNQHSGQAMLRHAAMWCVNVHKLNDAKFYVGVMTSKGGRFHSISRKQATRHIGQWIFGNTEEEEMDFTQCDKKQIQGLVRERNQYRQLLNQCLHALNTIPNRITIAGLDTGTTYELAAAIGSALKQSPNS